MDKDGTSILIHRIERKLLCDGYIYSTKHHSSDVTVRSLEFLQIDENHQPAINHCKWLATPPLLPRISEI
jgi:hypothetical protein